MGRALDLLWLLGLFLISWGACLIHIGLGVMVLGVYFAVWAAVWSMSAD